MHEKHLKKLMITPDIYQTWADIGSVLVDLTWEALTRNEPETKRWSKSTAYKTTYLDMEKLPNLKFGSWLYVVQFFANIDNDSTIYTEAEG